MAPLAQYPAVEPLTGLARILADRQAAAIDAARQRGAAEPAAECVGECPVVHSINKLGVDHAYDAVCRLQVERRGPRAVA